MILIFKLYTHFYKTICYIIMCTGSPAGQPCPGLHPQQRGHRDSAPLPRSAETPQEPCVQLWSPQHRTELELWEWGQRRPQQ